MFRFLQIQDQRKVGHHEHREEIHDNDACGKGDTDGLNRRHGREHERNETNHGRHG